MLPETCCSRVEDDVPHRGDDGRTAIASSKVMFLFLALASSSVGYHENVPVGDAGFRALGESNAIRPVRTQLPLRWIFMTARSLGIRSFGVCTNLSRTHVPSSIEV